MEAILRKEITLDKVFCRMIAVTVFVIFTCLGAFVRIPLFFTPVPVTLQTFFVLLAAALLGANLGVASQIVYILLGLGGLPVFAGAGSGLLYFLGPTAGYMFGFVLAAVFAGRFIKYSRDNLLLVFCILSLADFIILACGVTWIKLLLGYSFMKSFFIGFIPFIPGDLFKALAASVIYLKIKPRFKEIF